MRKYYLLISIIGIFILGLVIIAFSNVGFASTQNDMLQDEKRVGDFRVIKLHIEEYYRKNMTLPESLGILHLDSYLDPKTKTPYEYKIDSKSNYRLCATFLTSSYEISSHSILPTNDTSMEHTKGYTCMFLSIPIAILSGYIDLEEKSIAAVFPTSGDAGSNVTIYIPSDANGNWAAVYFDPGRPTAKIICEGGYSTSNRVFHDCTIPETASAGYHDISVQTNEHEHDQEIYFKVVVSPTPTPTPTLTHHIQMSDVSSQ